MRSVSPWRGRWQQECGSVPGAYAWEVKLQWVQLGRQFSDLAATAVLEEYPVLRALRRALMLPHQRHRKEMFASVTVIIFFHLLTFIKKKERHTQAWGVTDTVTPGEWKSDCRWALCLLLFMSLLNYSCYPRWPRSPMSDFTAWLLLQGHRWSYMCYLWSHAVLSDFALMQVIMSAWL